jgi:small subunit ribosomal protein S7
MAYKKWTRSEDQLRADARYNSRLASKFINCLMYDGKKSTAPRACSTTQWTSSKSAFLTAEPIEVFQSSAAERAAERSKCAAKRVGGANVSGADAGEQARRQQSLAIRWILLALSAQKQGPRHRPEAGPRTHRRLQRREGAADQPPAKTSTAWPTRTRRSAHFALVTAADRPRQDQSVFRPVLDGARVFFCASKKLE